MMFWWVFMDSVLTSWSKKFIKQIVLFKYLTDLWLIDWLNMSWVTLFKVKCAYKSHFTVIYTKTKMIAWNKELIICLILTPYLTYVWQAIDTIRLVLVYWWKLTRKLGKCFIILNLRVIISLQIQIGIAIVWSTDF